MSMEAKEKAEELVRKYYTFGLNNPAQSFSWYECQQCALIAVNEILDSNMINLHLHQMDYWGQVKIEIKKL